MFLATTSPRARTWSNYSVTGSTFFVASSSGQEEPGVEVWDGPVLETHSSYSQMSLTLGQEKAACST